MEAIEGSQEAGKPSLFSKNSAPAFHDILPLHIITEAYGRIEW